MKTCYRCNAAVADQSISCPACGAIQPMSPPAPPPVETLPVRSPTKRKNWVFPLAAAYLLLTTLITLRNVIVLAVSPVNFIREHFFVLIWDDVLLMLIGVITAILLFTRNKISLVFFILWGILYVYSQGLSWIVPYFRQTSYLWDVAPRLLWTLLNLGVIVVLALLIGKASLQKSGFAQGGEA